MLKASVSLKVLQMQFREVKMLAIGVIVASLATTNFIIPTYLDSQSPLHVTAVSTPVRADTVPEPVRALSPAEAAAKAIAMRAHADRVLAENDELPVMTGSGEASTRPPSDLICIAGCN